MTDPTPACSCYHPVDCGCGRHARFCDPHQNACDLEYLPDEGGLTRWGCAVCSPGQGLPTWRRARPVSARPLDQNRTGSATSSRSNRPGSSRLVRQQGPRWERARLPRATAASHTTSRDLRLRLSQGGAGGVGSGLGRTRVTRLGAR
jgi:hypothetical protein